jgi:prepilin-type N-terminal cleavage/methylation domain-containing protein
MLNKKPKVSSITRIVIATQRVDSGFLLSCLKGAGSRSPRTTKPFGIAMTNKRTPGFTLVELLLGLIIFALVAGSLYGMLYNGIKLDGKSQYIHKTYNEARIAFDAFARELPNAISYDFSASYPEQVAFAGREKELTFILPTDQGIYAVHYYAGRPDMGNVSKTILAGVVKNLRSAGSSSRQEAPVDFLMRQQSPLPDYLSKKETEAEVISAGLMKAGLSFEYGVHAKDERAPGGPELLWQQNWQKPSLPEAVRVTLTLFDPDHPDDGVELVREIYLPQGNTQQ